MTDAPPRSDSVSVAFECSLDERPETVWRALTTPEIVAEWLGPNTMAPDCRGAFEVTLAPEEGGVVACEILEASPPERLSYAWRVRDPEQSASVEMEVTFTLTPMHHGGTHLRIVHSGPNIGALVRRSDAVMLSAVRATHERRRLDQRRRLPGRPAAHGHRSITCYPVRLRPAA